MHKNITKIPKILLPKNDLDKSSWSVVACDQFTSQPEYWAQLKKQIGEAPSTLALTFPEVYLHTLGDEYKDVINQNMRQYLAQELFCEYEGLILVRRTLNNAEVRLGLMLAVDLEQYDYTSNNNAMIKATEKTVVERLPIRIKIRESAPLELPHIMLLMNDDEANILEKVQSESTQKLYECKLSMNGGYLEGFAVPNPQQVLERIEAMSCGKGILFAVGDGNHSLATAKECWNNIKKDLSDDDIINHPARYALCELVNLHDSSLKFEAIHRIVTGVDTDFIYKMQNALCGDATIKIVYDDKEYSVAVAENPSDAIADIQQFIDEYMAKNSGAEIDYIHGDEYLLEIAKRDKAVAVFMPVIKKDSLFSYVERRGVLPRKSFSMGHAEDKRYYFEARKITK